MRSGRATQFREGMTMESAIPPHLQTARSRHRRVGDDYQPPYPSFVARYKPAVSRVVMVYLGVQYRGATAAIPGAAAEALSYIAARFTAADGPSHWDRAHYVDQAGFSNVVSVAYWGGMRDRIPLSQTNEMAPGGNPELIRDGARLRIVAHDNLCLIRSGQDWSDTETSERKLYLEDVEPVLREGMDFLSDEGVSIGCYANRYMRVLGADGSPTEKSYGRSWWKSLAALERWAESHPTHVRIFGAA